MAKVKLGQGPTRMPELDMQNIVARCVERSLQTHIDAIVKEALDPRIQKLMRGLVVDLMQTADVAAVPLPKPAEAETSETAETKPAAAPAKSVSDAEVETMLDDMGLNPPPAGHPTPPLPAKKDEDLDLV